MLPLLVILRRQSRRRIFPPQAAPAAERSSFAPLRMTNGEAQAPAAVSKQPPQEANPSGRPAQANQGAAAWSHLAIALISVSQQYTS